MVLWKSAKLGAANKPEVAEQAAIWNCCQSTCAEAVPPSDARSSCKAHSRHHASQDSAQHKLQAHALARGCTCTALQCGVMYLVYRAQAILALQESCIILLPKALTGHGCGDWRPSWRRSSKRQRHCTGAFLAIAAAELGAESPLHKQQPPAASCCAG